MNEEGRETGRVLRTLLRGDLYERLEEYAKQFSNGLGKWDFGVAIERLLDDGAKLEQLNLFEERLTQLELEVFNSNINKEKNNGEKTVLLGKHHEEKKNGKD